MNIKTDLFNEFESVSAKEWKQKIQVDLKGLDYNETLLTTHPDGVVVKPFYHSDDVKPEMSYTDWSDGFLISEFIVVEDAIEANKKALECLENGTEALYFRIDSTSTNLSHLLNGISTEITDKQYTPVHLILNCIDKELVGSIKKLDNVHIHLDIISNLARTGNWFHSLKDDHRYLEEIAQEGNPHRSVLSVDMSLYQNAGASHVQQIAYGIAHALEYLNHFENTSLGAMQFLVSVGGDYFMEIAKLRALKWVYESVVEQLPIDQNSEITAFPSNRNKTVYDYNTNMLRTTSECMSAILGAADFVMNRPYDHIYHEPNDFGQRISRNQLHIMRHEAYLDRVSNPVDGSYYIEQLANDLAQKALDLVKDIERNGGFLAQLKAGTIQRKIKERANAEQALFDEGKLKLLGTNFQRNPDDRMSGELEKQPFVKFEKRKTLIEPIIEKRLSETMDRERLDSEN